MDGPFYRVLVIMPRKRISRVNYTSLLWVFYTLFCKYLSSYNHFFYSLLFFVWSFGYRQFVPSGQRSWSKSAKYFIRTRCSDDVFLTIGEQIFYQSVPRVAVTVVVYFKRFIFSKLVCIIKLGFRSWYSFSDCLKISIQK